LLDSDGQTLFRRLAVFRGTFSVEAAAAVAHAELDDLAMLVDQSLLKHVGSDRFLLLETLREFGVERLLDDEAQQAAQAHSAYYLSVIEQESARLEGPELQPARSRLLEEAANLRATLDHLASCGDAERLAAGVNGLWRFWMIAGMLRDGERYATLGLAHGAALPADVRIQLLRNAFWAHALLGHWDAASPAADERLRLARESGDPNELLGALSSSAVAFQSIEDYETARALGSEAVAVARELGDPGQICVALGNLAVTEQQDGDHAAPERLLAEEVEIRRSLDDPNRTADALANLGIALIYNDKPDAARGCLKEALPTLFDSDLVMFAWGLVGLALVAWSDGAAAPAASLLARGEALQREMGYTHTQGAMALHREKTQPLRDARADPDIDAAWHQGETMTLEAALAQALTV
jgi:tetratricopeptide (TPR) repeat protein